MSNMRAAAHLILLWLYNNGTLEGLGAAYPEARDPEGARRLWLGAAQQLKSAGLLTDDNKLTPEGEEAAATMVAALKLAVDMETAVEEGANKGLRF